MSAESSTSLIRVWLILLALVSIVPLTIVFSVYGFILGLVFLVAVLAAKS